MGRLTRKSLEYKDTWIADGSLSNIEGVVRGRAIDRLAEFEDLLEDLGVESVEELKDHLLICGILHDEQFIKEPDIWKLRLYRIERNRCRIAKQENQALKDRWKKLKEYLMYTLEEKQSSPKYYKFNNVLDKMKELEKED